MLQNLRGCARCGGEHPELEFRPLTRPVEVSQQVVFTHWASCPTNGEPILMAVVSIGAAPGLGR